MSNDLYVEHLSSMDECPSKSFCNHLAGPITNTLAHWNYLTMHTDEEAYQIAMDAEDGMYQVLRNIKNIEIYNKLDKTHFRPEVVDIVSVVNCVREAADAVCKTKIAGSSCAGPVLVRGDLALLVHALLELVRNSLSYTRDDNIIHIFMERDANRAIIKISDRGKGIRPEYQTQVFDPFFSMDPYGDSDYEPGLGLGLAIVYRLLQHLSSRPFVSSEYGRDNAIGFSLPIIKEPVTGEEIKTCNVGKLLSDRFSPLYLQLSGFCTYPT